MQMQRVWICVPTYDQSIYINTHYALQNAVDREGPVMVANEKNFNCSILPRTFNELWIDAYNHIDELKLDWIAMLHSDVDPGYGWLTHMVLEAIRTGATMLSANIRIKDGSGDHSTALDLYPRPDTAWGRRLRRISVSDCCRLPLTFNRHDVGVLWGLEEAQYGALLPNTGCWVARIADGWINRISFRIRTGIDWSLKPPKTWTDSEDWELGRDLYEMGFGDRVCATSRIDIGHKGGQQYRSWARDRRLENWPEGEQIMAARRQGRWL